MDFNQINGARQILGLDEHASLEEIKAAYKQLVLKYHPDRCRDGRKKECEEKLKEITHAKDILLTYCAGYKYSFKEKDVKRNTMDKDFYEHLKRFYDGLFGDLGL